MLKDMRRCRRQPAGTGPATSTRLPRCRPMAQQPDVPGRDLGLGLQGTTPAPGTQPAAATTDTPFLASSSKADHEEASWEWS